MELILIAGAALWPLVAKYIWPHTISTKEMVLNMVLPAIGILLVYQAGVSAKLHDVEIWNGQVTGKEQVWVSCDHSYDCNCRTECDSKGENCGQKCDTCYEHSNDWDWRVYTDIGEFNIDRVDRRGSNEPPRWSKVREGQPVAAERSYINYVKAVPESLFNLANEHLTHEHLPEYPEVYDYHHIDRVIPIGVAVDELHVWNEELALKLRRLGPEKQANVVIVITAEATPTFADALASHWLGGKKNDITVVIGSPQYPNIEWVRVLAWTDEEIFKVTLRDALLSLGTLDRRAVLDTIEAHTDQYFVRKPMKDFAYLEDEIDPPTWAVVLAFLIATIGNAGITHVFRQTQF